LPSDSPIPMNDLRRPYAAHREAIEAAVLETLRSGWWLNGPKAKSFAESFGRFVGVADCVPVANGTDALELALRAVRQRNPEGSEVVTVANAGGYATTACRQVGLVPVYADIEERSQLMSIDAAIAALSSRTGAVVATHLYGNAIDIPALRAAMAAAGHGHVAIVEDCAQAHGARVGSAMAGSMGDIATFSFYPTKNLGAMGDGGAVTTNDASLAQSVRRLQQYGWTAKYAIDLAGGRNSRMDEVQAAILEAMLPHIEAQNAGRQDIVRRYRAAAGETVRFIERSDGAVIHLAVVLCAERDRLRAFLSGRGIASDIHYPILDCDQQGWAGLPARIGLAGLAVSQAATARILSLPCFPGMTAGEVERVCAAIAAWESR
jgi:aminotransferase EvaB